MMEVKVMKRPINMVDFIASGSPSSSSRNPGASVPTAISAISAAVDKLAEFANTKMDLDVPKGCYHAFIVLKGLQFSFGPSGVETGNYHVVTKLRGYQVVGISPFDKAVSIGQTEKTYAEFLQWINIEAKPLFTSDKYKVAGKEMKNCIVFVKRACQFLEITFPEELQTQLNFLYNDCSINPFKSMNLKSSTAILTGSTVIPALVSLPLAIPGFAFGMYFVITDVVKQSKEKRRKRKGEVYNSFRQPTFVEKIQDFFRSRR